MERKKKVVIIGGGISGLSAGIYALKNGLDAVIVEKHNIPGGLCTGWDRQGFHIDGCIHWLTGTKENTLLNEMWKNIGAFKDEDDLIILPTFGTFNYQGTKVVFHRDLDLAEKEWTEISPIDKKEIHRFFNMVRDFCKVELPLDLPMKMIPLNRLIKLGLKVLSVWPSYLLSMIMKTDKYADRFKHPALRFAIKNVQPGPGNLFSMIYSYSTVVIGDGGVPKGGSKKMAMRMMDYFVSLGGTMLLSSPVNNVLVKNNTAYGVKLNNNKKVYGDYVVSCLDPNYTLNKLLLNQYKYPSITKKIEDPITYPTPTCVLVSFAIDKNLKIPSPYSFNCNPFKVGEDVLDHLTIRSYAFDESFDRDNMTSMTVLLDQYDNSFSFFKNLKKDPKVYQKYKQNLGEMIKMRIIEHLNISKDSIQLLDVCTPLTFNRYTNVTRGAYMGFMFTHKKPMYASTGYVHGLRNFLLSGQWLQSPGGLPLALAEGKFAIQRICKKENLNYIFSPRYFKKKKVNF